MLKAMFQKTQNPSFKVIYSIGSSKQSIIKWNFSCRIFKKFIEFEGLSEIKIKKGLIIKHEDFWDSGSNFYANIPIVGRLFRNIKKKLIYFKKRNSYNSYSETPLLLLLDSSKCFYLVKTSSRQNPPGLWNL